jgi:hypothetical protein
MFSTRSSRRPGTWGIGLVAGLLGLLMLGTGAWAQSPEPPAPDTRPRPAAPGLAVVVHQGRLSVDVQAADLGAVLAQIGQQAGLRIAAGPSPGKQVTARFTGVALEDGLRRLMRLASLSHSFLYARGPTGTVGLAEVRVWGEGQDERLRLAASTEPGVQVNTPHPGPPDRKARRQVRPGAARAGGSAESEAPQPIPDVVEAAPEPTRDPGYAAPSEATRRVLDVFTRSKQMGARPADGQDSSPQAPTPPSPDQKEGGGVSR